jgi:hypothetical protein
MLSICSMDGFKEEFTDKAMKLVDVEHEEKGSKR